MKKQVYQSTFTANLILLGLSFLAITLLIYRNFLPFTIGLHVSNFSISLMLCLGLGYLALLYGHKFRTILILGALVLLANLVCETVLSFLNTPDLLDALAGSFGVFVALAYLFFVSLHGLVPFQDDLN